MLPSSRRGVRQLPAGRHNGCSEPREKRHPGGEGTGGTRCPRPAPGGIWSQNGDSSRVTITGTRLSDAVGMCDKKQPAKGWMPCVFRGTKGTKSGIFGPNLGFCFVFVTSSVSEFSSGGNSAGALPGPCAQLDLGSQLGGRVGHRQKYSPKIVPKRGGGLQAPLPQQHKHTTLPATAEAQNSSH